jgi:hypothetical protein
MKKGNDKNDKLVFLIAVALVLSLAFVYFSSLVNKPARFAGPSGNMNMTKPSAPALKNGEVADPKGDMNKTVDAIYGQAQDEAQAVGAEDDSAVVSEDVNAISDFGQSYDASQF